jgi:GcrA cell cycle regulator
MIGEAWTDNDLTRLRALWAEGRSLAAIGRALRRSSSSVAGKAHRLGLPGRPSPIQRATLPPPAMMPPPPAPAGPRAAPVLMPVRLAADGGRGCQYVTDDTRYAQRFCEAPRADGSSYCPAHHALCVAVVQPALSKLSWRIR